MNRGVQLFLILLSNLFPLYGFFYLGWSPYESVLIFWIETTLIFFLLQIENIFRIVNKKWRAIFAFIWAFPTFLPFIGIHLILSTLMFGTTGNSLQWNVLWKIVYVGISHIWVGILLIVLRYIFDFIHFIKDKGYKYVYSQKTGEKTGVFFVRIFFMQLTIIIGGAIAKFTHNIALGVSLLVILQTMYSIYSFNKNKVTYQEELRSN